jgi:glycosyltransferase involved in cell wall biosynthesis
VNLDKDKPGFQKTVLVNALHAKAGGGITYLRNTLPLFAADSGIALHLCLHEDQQGLFPLDEGKITVHLMSFKLGFWRSQIREQLEIPRLARKIGADVVFSPANYGPLMAPGQVILLRNALNVASVERRALKMAYWAIVSLGTALSLMTCKRAMAVSDYARKAASCGLSGLVSGKVSIVHHGVGEGFSPPELDDTRDSFLLAVSDIYVQKNLETLIHAFSILCAEKPGLSLRIAGRPVDEDYYRRLQKIVSEKGLEKRVEFLGQVSREDLADLYRRCAVFVFPSLVETFGNPLLEAMACAAPIACSNAAAMPEVLGDAGLYFDPRDAAAMARVIARLLSDADLCCDLAKKALARSKMFTWERCASKTLDVLKQVAGR